MRIDLKVIAFLFSFWSYAAVAAHYPINGGAVDQHTVITSAAGTTTLVASSNQVQLVEGSTTQTIKLPDATLLPLHWWYDVINNSSGAVTVQNNSSSTIATVRSLQTGRLILNARASAAGTWKKTVIAGVNDSTNSIPANASTADAFSSNPADCPSGQFATAIAANGDLTCSLPAGSGDVTGPGSATDNAITRFDGVTGKVLQDSAATIDDSGNIAATSFIGPLTGNASTSSALAANPSDCASDTYATTIAANGNLTCSTISDTGLANSYLLANGSRALSSNWNAGAFTITASTFSGALSGNATTSSALAANPSDCASDRYATTIAANGDLTCAQVSLSAGVTSTLPVGSGGTGQTSYTDGQLLIGNSTGNTLTKATLTAGSGISITNGGGSISIATTGAGVPTVNTYTSNQTLTTSNQVVYCNVATSNMVLTLYSASNASRGMLDVKNLSRTGSCTILPTSTSEAIFESTGNEAQLVIPANGGAVRLIPGGSTVWYVH